MTVLEFITALPDNMRATRLRWMVKRVHASDELFASKCRAILLKDVKALNMNDFKFLIRVRGIGRHSLHYLFNELGVEGREAILERKPK